MGNQIGLDVQNRQQMGDAFFQKTNLTMAGVVLLSFPVILFFIFNQKKFVQGVMSSGIKA